MGGKRQKAVFGGCAINGRSLLVKSKGQPVPIGAAGHIAHGHAIISTSDVGRGHGPRRVASQSRSRRVCGGLSRERDRRARSLSCNGGRPPADWRLGRRRSAQAAHRNRGVGWLVAFDGAPPGTDLRPAAQNPRGFGRAPPHHRDVLRSCRIDRPCGQSRRRGLARFAQRLLRRSLGRGVANGRPCRQDARRRVDGSVRTPNRAGERFRTRRSRRARHSARARRT